MPCQGPSAEDCRIIEEHEKKLRTDPVYKAEYDEQMRVITIKNTKYVAELEENKRIESIKNFEDAVHKEMKTHALEKEMFDSHMTAMLCAVMKIMRDCKIMNLVPEDLRWWTEEHFQRDTSYIGSEISSQELAEKLVKLSMNYKVVNQ